MRFYASRKFIKPLPLLITSSIKRVWLFLLLMWALFLNHFQRQYVSAGDLSDGLNSSQLITWTCQRFERVELSALVTHRYVVHKRYVWSEVFDQNFKTVGCIYWLFCYLCQANACVIFPRLQNKRENRWICFYYCVCLCMTDPDVIKDAVVFCRHAVCMKASHMQSHSHTIIVSSALYRTLFTQIGFRRNQDWKQKPKISSQDGKIK